MNENNQNNIPQEPEFREEAFNRTSAEDSGKTIIIDDADTQTLRQMADKPARKKRLPREKRTLDSINKNAKWYPFRVIGFIFNKALSYALNILLTLLLIGAVTGIAVACAFVIYIRNFVDLEYSGLDNLKFTSEQVTQIYWVDDAGNEHELADDRLHGSENRLWANYNEFPQTLIDAYVTIEDQRFWDHKGVDAKRTFSAVFNFFIPTSSNYGGGSTITQQLIKNVSGENEATIQRKVQEIFRALDVESKYSKSEILEMYLNTIYLSQNTNGVCAAAETYFNKELKDLTLVECAAIAAIGKSPVFYDPILNPQNNLERRNLVLREMLRQKKITQEEYNEAYDAPLELYSGEGVDNTTAIHNYYIDAVIEEVIADLGKEYGYDRSTASNLIFSGGLKIYICMDPALQASMEEVFINDKYWPEASGVKAQGAMVLMDPDTGDVLALVGGRGEKKESRGLNRATMSKRQPGSSIKPLSVYTLALEKGLYTYGSSIDDVPQMLVNDKYWPSNAELRYDGLVSFKYAVMKSKNTTAVATLTQLGINNVYDHLTKDLGFTTIEESDKAEAPLALGGFTYGVTVMEMTQGYSALANEGVWSEARLYTKVLNINDEVILEKNINQEMIYSEDTAYIMGRLLKSTIHESAGTGYRAITLKNTVPGLEVCGKTGTTTSKRDYYFAGYTPDFVACCWYGYDNNKTITTNTQNPAAMLWNYTFEKIYAYMDENEIDYQLEFDRPASVITAEFCTLSGDLVTEACQNDAAHILGGQSACIDTGYFTLDTLPSVDCATHVSVNWDTATKAICLPGCKCENTITLGFRHTPSRLFLKQVTIADAQYTYRELPVDYMYPSDPSLPFYDNLAGTYYDEEEEIERRYWFGTSGVDLPFNRICLEHFFFEDSKPEDPDTSGETSEDEIPWWDW